MIAGRRDSGIGADPASVSAPRSVHHVRECQAILAGNPRRELSSNDYDNKHNSRAQGEDL